MQVIENWWEGAPLQKIDLSNNEITSIPDEVGLQEEVQWFNIANNKL